MTKEQRKSYQREWNLRNPEKLRAAKARYRSKPDSRAKEALSAKKWRAANREKDRENRRKWKLANPDKIKAQYERKRLNKKSSDAHGQRRRSLARAYRISIEEFGALLVLQAGRCAICGTSKANSRGHQMYVDHCHESGLVRGLLCSKCNSALGYFGDSPRRLRRAAAYLENWRGKTAPDERRGFQPVLALAG